MDNREEEAQAPVDSSPLPSTNDDGILRRIAANTLMGATSGTFLGTLLATYRGHSVPFYAASMGTNYGVASLVFFGSEALIRASRGNRRDALGYAGAGCVTGLAMTLPIGGRYQALVAGVTMAGVGVGGFYAHQSGSAYLEELGQKRLRERREREARGLVGEGAGEGQRGASSAATRTGGWGSRR